MEAIGRFLIRFRGSIVVLLMVLIASSGLVVFLDSRSTKIQEAGGDAMYSVMKRDDNASLQDLMTLADESKGVTSALVKFKLASRYIKDGKDIGAAKKIYGEIAEDKSLVPELRELAGYYSALLAISGDYADPKLEESLSKLAAGKESVYRSSLKEAIIALKLKKGEFGPATWVMREVIGDPASHPDIKRNVESLFRVYGNK